MTKPHRQHGIGSLAPDEKIVGKPGGIVEPGVKQYGIFKKIKKAVKKVVKSPIGKIGIGALLAGAPLGGGKWFGSGSGWGKGIGFLRNRGILGGSSKLASGLTTAQHAAMRGVKSGAGTGSGIWNWIKKNPGQSAMLGLGAGAMALPFMAGKVDDEEEEDDWSITPPSISNIRNMARLQDPSLAFLPKPEYTQPGFYAAEGGIASLANGGGAAEAQAEQMLKMEYQKYRNQGGTMSYQQFKMAVLQQAQQQGPMAQGQPQMAAYGGRMGYQNGEFVMVEETPTGMMEENVEEVQGEPTREQLEALAMEIFQLRLEELDEEQLMVVYQAAMEQQPQEEMMQEEDIQFDPQMAGPAMAAEGGLMSLGGMEKDYRQEGGFVPLGKKEKADDVPARLSKNEFVFTADAVRNAGGGDIDQGAEVMQNMMNHLESGGQISEDSQGAQGMYNNMKQLETRVG
jgi:hypothetical protein